MSAPGVSTVGVQETLDDLGEPLSETTFVVVDLETTGICAQTNQIIEIGAVKVRGGKVLGEFQTLVNPGVAISPFITVLTGITDAMVIDSPHIGAVLPSFLEFARGSILVAHNAPFDIGFLRAAQEQRDETWPTFRTIDTAKLARRLVGSDTDNCKLSTLARYFHVAIEPNHRALSDARATVHVLHALLERLGPYGIISSTDLLQFMRNVTPAQRRKKHLAESLPHVPGVYIFRNSAEQPLYIGTSHDIRTRVRGYFSAAETRVHIKKMIKSAIRIDAIECAHSLEAQIRELQLIAAHKPPYNKLSRYPEGTTWVKVTVEKFPRLITVSKPLDDEATYLGPFGSRGAAEEAISAIHSALPLRQCSIDITDNTNGPACWLFDIGRCSAPCIAHSGRTNYAHYVSALTGAIVADPRVLLEPLLVRMSALGTSQQYEKAAVVRDHVSVLVRALARQQRLRALATVKQMIAARPGNDRRWEISVMRYGRLAGAGVLPAGTAPQPYIDGLEASSATVLPDHGPLRGAQATELECLLRWLASPGVRLVRLDGVWCEAAYGAGGLTELLTMSRSGEEGVSHCHRQQHYER